MNQYDLVGKTLISLDGYKRKLIRVVQPPDPNSSPLFTSHWTDNNFKTVKRELLTLDFIMWLLKLNGNIWQIECTEEYIEKEEEDIIL